MKAPNNPQIILDTIQDIHSSMPHTFNLCFCFSPSFPDQLDPLRQPDEEVNSTPWRGHGGVAVLQGSSGRIVGRAFRGKERGGATAEFHRVRTPAPSCTMRTPLFIQDATKNVVILKSTKGHLSSAGLRIS